MGKVFHDLIDTPAFRTRALQPYLVRRRSGNAAPRLAIRLTFPVWSW